MSPARPVYQCPVDASIDALGGKWKLIILFYVLQAPRRNGELRRLIPAISQKMLTQQLRELETDGLLTRTVQDRVPPHVTYAVASTERARLERVLAVLCEFGIYWSDKTDAIVLTARNSA